LNTRQTISTRAIMLRVVACLAPGAALQLYFFGAGLLLNLLTATIAVLACEALCLHVTAKPVAERLFDGSAVVTACLLALALPPGVPWQVMTIAAVAAVGVGKYAYGGLGNNIFNPALVGYAIVLVSFPQAMGWPTLIDGFSGATTLTTFKFRGAETIADIWTPLNGFGTVAAAKWEWLNLAFLLGGLSLIAWRLIAWRIPAAMLLTIAILAAIGYDNGSSRSFGSPLFHGFSGATMLAAFFFATDPVTHPASHKGQWLFGILAGAMTFAVRALGNYPDGAAFGILLANAITPYLDRRWALPVKTHGH